MYIAKFPLKCDKVGFSINQDPSLAFRSLKKNTFFHELLFLNLVIHVRTALDNQEKTSSRIASIGQPRQDS
jgi:hypothetical protein